MATNYLTQEGLDNLKAELKELETVQRPKVSQQIADARDKGDLSENAEYDAAKEAQGLLEMKISQLKDTIANSRVIDDSQLDTSKALILSKLKLKHLGLNKEFNYTLVSETEADLKTGKISIDSPIGKGLLGKSVGDVAEITVPNGTIKFEILDISR